MKRSASQHLKTSMTQGASLAVIVVWVAMVLLAGCSRSEDNSANLYQLMWPNEQGGYEFQDVRIESLRKPVTLEGDVARILIDPYVSFGKLTSATPLAQYVVADNGVLVPSNSASHQAFAVYAHFERLKKIDLQLGLGGVLEWPLTIGLEANVVNRDNQSMSNNALYDGRLDALLLVPYLEDKLPIALNAGILAHEHFHKIFQTLVLNRINQRGPGWRTDRRPEHWQPMSGAGLASLQSASEAVVLVDPSKSVVEQANMIPKSLYNMYLLKGLNEGLADFWGYVYSGDSSYIRHSLPELDSEERRVDRDFLRLQTDLDLRLQMLHPTKEGQLLSEEVLIAKAYRLGTQYARFLHKITVAIGNGDERSETARLAVAAAVMRALESIGPEAAKVGETSYLSPNLLFKSLFLQLPQADQKVCGLLRQFASPDASPADLEACRTKGGP